MSKVNENRKGYKETKVGWIPDSWHVVTLREIGKMINGLTYSPKDVRDTGTLVLRSSNVQNRQLSFKDNVYVDTSNLKVNPVKGNDILICVRNGSRSLIGKNALIDKSVEGKAFGAFMSIYRSEHNDFVFQVFDTDIYRKEVHRNLGATINSINNSDLGRFAIPFPPISEQKKIAEILSAWDEAIEMVEMLIEKKKELKKGFMQVLLTGKVRFSEFVKSEKLVDTKIGKVPEDWEVVKLFLLVDFENGKAHESYVDSEGKYVLVNSKFISTGGRVKKHVNENLLPLVKGDVAMVMSDIPNGRALARCFYIEEDNKYALNQRICKLRVNDFLDSRYLYYTLNRNRYYLKFDDGVSQTNLRKDQVLDCPILQMSIEEQKKIAELLSEQDREIELLKDELEKLKLEKKGLMQKLLTGEVRVKLG